MNPGSNRARSRDRALCRGERCALPRPRARCRCRDNRLSAIPCSAPATAFGRTSSRASSTRASDGGAARERRCLTHLARFSLEIEFTTQAAFSSRERDRGRASSPWVSAGPAPREGWSSTGGEKEPPHRSDFAAGASRDRAPAREGSSDRRRPMRGAARRERRPPTKSSPSAPSHLGELFVTCPLSRRDIRCEKRR